MNINITISTLDAATKRQLAVIAKRAVNKEGESLFSVVSPSSAEEAAFRDFYNDAIVLLNTKTQHFVSATTTPTPAPTAVPGVPAPAPSMTLTFYDNHNGQLDDTISMAFQSFIVAYAVAAWLDITYPAVSERYHRACLDKLSALTQLIFHKTPPKLSYNP